MKPEKIVIHPYAKGEPKPEVNTISEILALAASGWDPENPGIGKSVLLPDGREVPNPIPFAPALDATGAPDIMTQMFRRLRAEQLRKDELEFGDDDPDDYPEDDDPMPMTEYELIMMEEYPTMPSEAPPDDPSVPPNEPPPPAPPAAPPPEPPKKKGGSLPPSEAS